MQIVYYVLMTLGFYLAYQVIQDFRSDKMLVLRKIALFAGGIFRGYDPSAGGAAVHAASGVDLSRSLDTPIDGTQPLERQFAEASTQILRAYLGTQWRDGPAKARVETRNDIPNADGALLHLDRAEITAEARAAAERLMKAAAG